MENPTFAYSQSSIVARRRLLWLMAFLMPILIFFFVMVSNPVGMDWASMLRMIFPSLLFFFVLFAVISLTVGRATLKRLAELKIVLEKDCLVRQGGKFEERIPYSDIQRAVTTENSDRGVVHLKLYFLKGSATFSGFENMHSLAKGVLANLKETQTVDSRKQRVDWENPFAIVGLTAAIALVLFSLLKLCPGLDREFPRVFNLVFAAYLIAYRPLSKAQGIRFRKWEWVLGGLIILFTAVSLALRWI